MKICIIGGSVAGLECAINLAKEYDVTVYEEHAEIGLPLKCAEGWINFSGLKPYVGGRKLKDVHVSLFDGNFSVIDSFTLTATSGFFPRSMVDVRLVLDFS